MFGIDSGELFLIALVAIAVIGPKDLPRVMRTVGHWVSKARGMANQFRAGVDQMVRESEVADLEKKWREQNEAIMRANPFGSPPPPAGQTVSDWGLSTPAADENGQTPLGKPKSEAAAVGDPSPPQDDGTRAASPSVSATKGGRRPPVAPGLVKPSQPAPRAAASASEGS